MPPGPKPTAVDRARREVFTPILLNDRAYVLAEEAVEVAVRAGGIPAPHGRWRLARRVQRVATAQRTRLDRAAGTREQLREALLDLAAGCVAWAARLRPPPSFHSDPDQLSRGRGEPKT